MNKYALILNSFVYTAARAEYVKYSLTSLAKTNLEELQQPILQITTKKSNFDYTSYVNLLSDKFMVQVNDEEDFEGRGIDPTFICSINYVLDMYPEVTHITYLTDDMVYNPEWLGRLDKLIERHPEAIAWTVYRSSHTRHHKILSTKEYLSLGIHDCLVTSIAGVGTLSRKEWKTYNLDGKLPHGSWCVPNEAGGGNTVDLHHAYARPGERWATGRDYWNHIGDVGTHSHKNLDQAIDFVGEN
jgi:hypothetical protein